MKIRTHILLRRQMYRRALQLLIFALPVVCLPACSPIGPNTVARDRFEYTDAISESWKRQMLLNIVKIRYADAPVFLEVSSIISQYALETELQGSLRFDARNNQFLFGRGKYTDRVVGINSSDCKFKLLKKLTFEFVRYFDRDFTSK